MLIAESLCIISESVCHGKICQLERQEKVVQGFECRLFGEVLKEDVKNVQETLENAATEPQERFRLQEIVFSSAPASHQFQKTVCHSNLSRG